MTTLVIARLTFLSYLRQPMLWLTTIVGLAFLVLSTVFGMFNFFDADRLRLVCTAGVAITTLNGLFLGTVGASSAIGQEFRHRTILVLFAKPISPAGFMAGKALGIWGATLLSLTIIAAAHLVLIAILARHGFPGSRTFFPPEWVPYHRVATGHLLAALNAGVMTCLAAALAARLGTTTAIVASFAVFIAAHVLAGLGLPSTVFLPAATLFNIDDSIQSQRFPLNLGYFSLCVLHGALYASCSLVFGTILMNRRDLV